MKFSCGTLILTSPKPRGSAEHRLGNTSLDCQFKHTSQVGLVVLRVVHLRCRSSLVHNCQNVGS
jgi:hypothetical protein